MRCGAVGGGDLPCSGTLTGTVPYPGFGFGFGSGSGARRRAFPPFLPYLSAVLITSPPCF